MIARLRGTVLEKAPTRVVLDVGGVGYEVHVPLSSFADIGEPGSTLTLHVHTHVRDDAILLFGFSTSLELSLFERLITVSGIGPRVALAVLSGLPPSELVEAIAAADLARLTSIPGVGRKTAERMVVELKDRISAFAAAAPAETGGGTREDLVSALVNLGYHRAAAEKAVNQALASVPDGGFEGALRHALRSLTR
ncbi:MAG TPA: Holliday junction branch migration protein RuvA [Vicinamibacterales bacterium]